MNREDIIRIARNAGAIPIHKRPKELAVVGNENIERFFQAAYAAGADAERNRLTWTQEHWTEYERNIAAAAKAEENEACAQVCEQEWNDYCAEQSGYALAVKECAAAIRARGQA